MLGALLLVRTLVRNRAVESRLRQVSGAFAALLEERFAGWGLTRSERDVAWFTIKGLSIAEIARLRGTSEGTVKAHSNAIYRKAGVSGRTQLLSLFIEDLMDGAPQPRALRPPRRSPRDRSGGAACPGRRRRRKPPPESGAAVPPGGRRAGAGARARYGMEKLEIGDLVVLTSGSMRMAVEAVDGEQVACVWCHEGEIGRDAFDARLLKKWEFREEDGRPAPRRRPSRTAATARAAASPTAPPTATSGRAASPAGTASRARRSSSARTAEAFRLTTSSSHLARMRGARACRYIARADVKARRRLLSASRIPQDN